MRGLRSSVCTDEEHGETSRDAPAAARTGRRRLRGGGKRAQHGEVV